MKIFKHNKKIEFIPAVCPKCGGRLEIDSSFEVAYCKDCGFQVFIKNAKRGERGLFDKVLGAFERQQEFLRQDIQEEKRKEMEYQLRLHNERRLKGEKRSLWWHANWWKLALIGLAVIILSMISSYLGLV